MTVLSPADKARLKIGHSVTQRSFRLLFFTKVIVNLADLDFYSV